MILVGFSTRRDNLLSRLIRWGTHSRFSHTFIVYDHNIYGTSIVVEASVKGIVELTFASFLKTSDDVILMAPPSGVDLDVGMKALAPTLDTPFDSASLIGRVFVIIAGWFGRKIKNPLGDVKRDCCVENVLRCLLAANAVPSDIDPEVESPQSLYDRLDKSGWTVTSNV